MIYSYFHGDPKVIFVPKAKSLPKGGATEGCSASGLTHKH
jgi:hypothetical protein